jgi:hypothetical protein
MDGRSAMRPPPACQHPITDILAVTWLRRCARKVRQRDMFQEIVSLITRLRAPPTPA